MSAQLFRRVLGEAYERPGWSWEMTSGGHIKGRHTSGAFVFEAASPSDHRGHKNMVSRMKRAEKSAKSS